MRSTSTKHIMLRGKCIGVVLFGDLLEITVVKIVHDKFETSQTWHRSSKSHVEKCDTLAERRTVGRSDYATGATPAKTPYSIWPFTALRVIRVLRLPDVWLVASMVCSPAQELKGKPHIC